VVGRYTAMLDRSMRLEGRLFCLVAADVRGEPARTAAGEWRQIMRRTGRAVLHVNNVMYAAR
jgi:hypothetical protein